MGSDGLFDKQSNSEIVRAVFKKAHEMYNTETMDINRIALACSEYVVKEAIDKKAMDNVSCNIIFFDNFINSLNGRPVTDTSSHGLDYAYTPKKDLHKLGIASSLPSHLNFDLTDNDIDRNHSSKALEYMLNNMKKRQIINEGHNILDKHSKGFGNDKLFSKTSSSNIIIDHEISN